MRYLHAIRELSVAVAIGALALGPVSPAIAETPEQICSRVATDDTLRPIPASLVPAINTLFHTNMPTRVAIDSTVFRCFDNRVVVCTAGANLPCGKANTSRTSAGAAEWCRDNPDAGFVPASATGHDTIYEWRCHDGAPEVIQQVGDVDSRGFIAQYWKRLH